MGSQWSALNLIILTGVNICFQWDFMECSEFVLFIAVSFREFLVDIPRDFASQF
jgi:hypothetical protein